MTVSYYIYIYIYIYICVCVWCVCVCVCVCVSVLVSVCKCVEIVAFGLFERQAIGLLAWCSISILINFLVIEAFPGEAFVIGNIYLFTCLRLRHRISSLFYLKTSILIPVNKHSRLANQSQIILSSSTTFWLVNLTIAQINIRGKSIISANQILIGHPT